MRDALQILVRPRASMRRILDSGRLRWMPQVLAAAVLSSLTEAKNRPVFSPAVIDSVIQNALIIVGGVLLGCALVLLIFYGLSWIAWFAGRMFDGTGSPREIRSALAWGVMPVIAVSVIKLPLILALPAAGTIGLDVRTCGTAAVLAALGVVQFTWYLVVASLALAEAHRVSAFGGIATLLLTLISPVVLAIAAFLSFR